MVRDFINGMLAGVIGIYLTQPMDTVRVIKSSDYHIEYLGSNASRHSAILFNQEHIFNDI